MRIAQIAEQLRDRMSDELQQRMDANALILRDMLSQFQRELVAIYDPMRHKDIVSPLRATSEQVGEAALAALAAEQAQLVAESGAPRRRRRDPAGITGLSAQLGELASQLEAARAGSGARDAAGTA